MSKTETTVDVSLTGNLAQIAAKALEVRKALRRARKAVREASVRERELAALIVDGASARQG